MNKDEQLALNHKLLDACLTEPVDCSRVEALLRQGAEPMGEIRQLSGENPVYGNLYDEVVCSLFQNENTPESLYTLTELFLRYGLDVSNPSVPYDDGCVYSLWMFAFYGGDWVLKTLKLLLDHGLSAEAASDCWSHAALSNSIDFFLNTPRDYDIFYDYIRKLMLFASYPHVLDNDEYLRREIWLEKNDCDLLRFRSWNDFRYEICDRHGRKYECFLYSVVTILEKESGKAVWRFGVDLDPEGCPDLWLKK